MVGHHAGDLPRTPCGAGEHLLCPMLPATRPAPSPWTSTRVGPAARRRRSRDAGQAAALGSDQPLCEPAAANTAPSLPVRPDAGRRPRRPQTTGARRPAAPNPGTARHTEPLQGPARRGQPGGSAADTGGLPVRTPGCTGRLDTERLDAGRLDAGRPLDRLDGRPHDGTGDEDRATTGLGGVRTYPRDRRPPAGRPDLARVTAPGALGHPGRLRGDGTCTAALTAAATGQLPSTAPHEAAPRRTALLR